MPRKNRRGRRRSQPSTPDPYERTSRPRTPEQMAQQLVVRGLASKQILDHPRFVAAPRDEGR